jgi:hypothetical protein
VARAQGPTPLASALHTHVELLHDLVEGFFKELTERRLKRGVFTSVTELEAAITEWIATWNLNPKPFTWKATAEQIIEKVQRGRAALTRPINSTTDH